VRFSALLLLLLVTPVARAHALGAEVKLRGNRVEVEAYYSDDTPARDAHVIIHNAADQVIAEGRTDDRGRWQFPVPPAGRYSVVVDAGAGHRKTVNIAIPNQTSDGETVSEGPPREEFTRFPWGRVALGLAIIAALGGGWLALRRRFRRMPGPQSDRGTNL
jgi:nickel transport protein